MDMKFNIIEIDGDNVSVAFIPATYDNGDSIKSMFLRMPLVYRQKAAWIMSEPAALWISSARDSNGNRLVGDGNLSLLSNGILGKLISCPVLITNKLESADGDFLHPVILIHYDDTGFDPFVIIEIDEAKYNKDNQDEYLSTIIKWYRIFLEYRRDIEFLHQLMELEQSLTDVQDKVRSIMMGINGLYQ